MKKIILLFIYLGIFNSSTAQNPTYRQKLFYTCKVWGFVKYFHSGVSTCKVNWDSVLVADLPLVKNAATRNDFNNALHIMLNAAGPMAIAKTNPPPQLPLELRRNANFNWINDPMLRNDVQVVLDTIKNNFRPHPSCWVQENNDSTSNLGWLLFPHDSLILPGLLTTNSNYFDEWRRGLILFRFWNIINYFDPYNYVWNNSSDSILFNHDVQIVTAPDPSFFFLQFKMLCADLNDVHVEGMTFDNSATAPDIYYYGTQLELQYVSNKYVAVKSNVKNIAVGDEIISVNGITPLQFEDSLRPYISAGNISVFRREIAKDMLCGPNNSSITIVSKDSLGNNHTSIETRTHYNEERWFTDYNPNDSLGNVSWKKWNGNIGYVNMGKLQPMEVNTMYDNLQNTSAVIFDLRNYPNGTAWSIADLMYPQQKIFAMLAQPDVTFPGTFYWYKDFIGKNGNATPYHGKIIVLMNEETQSQAEYSCMILDAMPDVVNVGSQTAGTDGDVTFLKLTPSLQTGFTTLGVYFPNGDSTERIGIVPDSLVYPTQEGIRHHRDEVLEKALEIAGWKLPMKKNSNENPKACIRFMRKRKRNSFPKN